MCEVFQMSRVLQLINKKRDSPSYTMKNVNSYICWLQVTVRGTGLDQVKLKAPPTQAGGSSLPFLPIRLWELAVALGLSLAPDFPSEDNSCSPTPSLYCFNHYNIEGATGSRV